MKISILIVSTLLVFTSNGFAKPNKKKLDQSSQVVTLSKKEALEHEIKKVEFLLSETPREDKKKIQKYKAKLQHLHNALSTASK